MFPYARNRPALLAGLFRPEEPKHKQLTAVPFTDVKFSDEFWTPRLETNREKSLPHNFEWCEKTGRINNFAKAGKLMHGKFEGIVLNDSDVFKVLEGRLVLAGRPSRSGVGQRPSTK